MASPLSAEQLLTALRAQGLTVVEHAGWRTHNRNHKGSWGPVHGVIIHHTVTSGSAGSVELCFNGYSTLPGPLCHGVIDKEGIVHLVGNGRANHAGSGDGDVLTAVVAERATLPAPNENDTDGNVHFYGFECVNLGDGKDPWPEVQLEAMVRASAALCHAHGWSANSVIGHKEWTNTKIDPKGFTMASFRARVAARLKAEQDPKPPAASRPVVDLSKLIAAAKTDPPKKGTPVSYAGTKTVEAALVAEGLLTKSLADGHYGTATKTAYAGWQRRCGWTGKDADGIPGLASLTKLGKRRGFDVKE